MGINRLRMAESRPRMSFIRIVRHGENRLVISNWIPFDQCGHICFVRMRDAEHQSE
jgi:hypothetical protein